MNDIKKIVLFKDGVSKDKGSWVIFRDSGYEIVSLDEGKKIVLDYAERHGINTVEKANKELYDKVVFYSPNFMLAFRYNLNKQEVSVSDEKTESEVGTFADVDDEVETEETAYEYVPVDDVSDAAEDEKTESKVSTFADVDDEVETDNGDSFDFEEGTIAKPFEYRKIANYGFGSDEADGSNSEDVSIEKTKSEVSTFAAHDDEVETEETSYEYVPVDDDSDIVEDDKTESEVSTFADVDDGDDEVETEETAYEYVLVDNDSDVVEDEKTESEVSTFAAHDDGDDEVETEETAYEYVPVDDDSDVVEDEKTESEVSTFAAHDDYDEVETDNGDSFDFEEGTIAKPFEYGKFSNYGFGSDEADGSNSEDVSVEKTESEVSTFADVDDGDDEVETEETAYEYVLVDDDSDAVEDEKTESEVSTFAAHDDYDEVETDNGDSFDFEEGTIAKPFEYGKFSNYGFGSDEADGSNSEDVSVKKTESEVSTFADVDDGDDEVETEETADEFVLVDDDESDDEIDAEETADEYDPEADESDDEIDAEETADEYDSEADEADDEIDAEETADEYDPDDDDDDESDDEIDAEETENAEKMGFFDKFLDFIMKYGVNPKEDEFIYDEDEYDSEEDEDEYDSDEDEYEDEDEDEYDSDEDEDEYEDEDEDEDEYDSDEDEYEDEDLGMFEKLKIMGGKLLDFINKSTLFHVSVAVISGIIIFFGIRFFENRDKDDIYVNNNSNTVNVNEDSDYFTSPLASFFNKIFSTRNSLVEEEIENKDSLTGNDSDIAVQYAPYSQDDDTSSYDNSSNFYNNSNSSNDNSDITVQYAPYSQDDDTGSYDNSSNSYNNSNSSNDNSDIAVQYVPYSQDDDTSSYDNSSNSYNNSNSSNDNSDITVQYASYSQDDDTSSYDNSSNSYNNSNSSNDNSDIAVQYASYSQDDDISINDSSDNIYYDEESATVYEYGVSDSVENNFNDISESYDSDDIAITDDELFYLDNVDSDIVETEDETYDYTIYNSLDTVNGDLPGIILYDGHDYSNISNFYDNSAGDQTNLDLPDPNDYSSFIDYYINSLANTNPDLPDNGIQYTRSI